MLQTSGRRLPKKLSAETKWEIFLQVATGGITQADAARRWAVDVSTITGIRRTVTGAALVALARTSGRPAKERDFQLEAAILIISRRRSIGGSRFTGLVLRDH